jgi:hypothetical protein
LGDWFKWGGGTGIQGRHQADNHAGQKEQPEKDLPEDQPLVAF